MHSATAAVTVTMVGLAAVSFVLAYLIGVRGMTGLISGHQHGTAQDERGLARGVGISLAAMGVCMVAFAVLYGMIASAGQRQAFWLAFLFVTVGSTISLLQIVRRYR